MNNCPDLTHRFVLCIYIILVSFLNLILLHFIYYKTSKSMRDYKIILYSTTIIDFTSAWMQFLIGIRPTLENDMQTFNFDGLLPQLLANLSIFSGGRLHFLAMLETFTTAFSFAFGIIPFIYRYMAVCWNYTLNWMQLLALSCCTGFLAIWSSLSFAIMSNQFYEQNSPGIPTNPQCLRSLPSWTSAQAESDYYGSVRAWFYGLLGILYSYVIIFFCGWRIYVNIKKQAFMFVTKKAKSTQRQLSITIGMQAACPLIVTGSSLIFLYIGIKTEFHKADSFVVLFYSFMVFPILNPCISLIFISTYRRGFGDFCRWLFGRKMVYGGWRNVPAFFSTVSIVSKDGRSDANRHMKLRSIKDNSSMVMQENNNPFVIKKI